jgi:hypothetical protein
MGMPYRARVDERWFLNLPGFHGGAYIVTYVEDTSARIDAVEIVPGTGGIFDVHVDGDLVFTKAMLRDLAVFATSEPANLPPARPVIVSPVKAGLSARTRMTAGGSAAAARDDSTRVKVRFSLDVRAGYGAERRWPQQTNSM